MKINGVTHYLWRAVDHEGEGQCQWNRLSGTGRGHIRAAGHASLRAIAVELTARGIRTRRGGKWGVSNIHGLLRRLEG